MMDKETKEQVLKRLKRLEGQVGGVMKMVENDKYCVDLLIQISAVRGALDKVAQKVLRSHMETCVQKAMSSGNEREQKVKMDELMEVFSRYAHLK